MQVGFALLGLCSTKGTTLRSGMPPSLFNSCCISRYTLSPGVFMKWMALHQHHYLIQEAAFRMHASTRWKYQAFAL